MDDVVDRKNPPPVTRAPDHFYGRVLRPGELLDHARYSTVRVVPETLRPFVKRFWAVDWDLEPGEKYQTATVSEPTINLTFEYGDIRRASTTGPGAWITGPITLHRFDVGIRGRGGVFGVNFHLGATLAFSEQAPSDLREKTAPASTWFPQIEDDLDLAEVFVGPSPPDVSHLAEAVEAWLLARRPQVTDSYARFRQVLEVLEDPALISLGELSNRVEMSERSLQRMFDRYCGVGVKKLLTRARVIDAVSALDRGWDGTFAELGAGLGWFDQSHFNSDFLRITGYRPGEYVQQIRR